MSVEILNRHELVDLIERTGPDEGYTSLQKALCARYPKIAWRVGSVSPIMQLHTDVVYDVAGEIVAQDLRTWLKDLVAEEGGDFLAAWEKHRSKGYCQPLTTVKPIHFGGYYGAAIDEIAEVKIEHHCDIETRGIFSSWKPDVLEDFLAPTNLEEVGEWNGAHVDRCKFISVNYISQSLKQLAQHEFKRRHEWAANHVIQRTTDGITEEISALEYDRNFYDVAPAARRFLQDWETSSANSEMVTKHWVFDVSTYRYDGSETLRIVPRPLHLPDRIKITDEMSIFGVMDLLDTFDKQAGYKMAWFFHAVYGNRVTPSVIREIAEGIEDGLIGLPQTDKDIVLKWADNGYNF